MRTISSFLFAALLMVIGWTPEALAKECKASPTIVQGDMKRTRVAAYPSSLFAWRKAVREDHGKPYQSWRRASERKITCKEARNDAGRKRWQCTRTAIPCARDGQGSNDVAETPDYPGYVLQRGAEGDDVKTLQRLLDDAGYKVDIDGDFGNKTRNAVRKFQKDEAIKVDGRVGPETWERIAA